MRIIFQIAIISTFLSGCAMKNGSERENNTVYVDGKEIIINSSTNGDSSDFDPDSNYFNNQKIKAASGEGVVPN